MKRIGEIVRALLVRKPDGSLVWHYGTAPVDSNKAKYLAWCRQKREEAKAAGRPVRRAGPRPAGNEP